MRIEAVLGSRNRIKVLRVMLRRDCLSGRQVSRLAELSPSAANTSLGELVETGILYRNGSAGKHLYELNREHFLMAIIEKLFNEENVMPPRVAEIVKRHLNGLSARVQLLGLGIFEDGGMVIVTRPETAIEDPVIISLSAALRSEFCLVIRKTASELAALSGSGLVWLASGDRPGEKAKKAARERTLNFFGLGLAHARQGQLAR